MISRRGLCIGVLAGALLGAGSGCGGSGPKLYKVSGKVTLDGVPVAGAGVHFEPTTESGAAGAQGADGITGADGVYNLTTFTTNDGAIPGDYKVSVKKPKTLQPVVDAPTGGTDPGAMVDLYKKAMQPGKEKSRPKSSPGEENELPADYANPEKSGLKCQVPPPGGKFDIPLRKGGGT